MRKPSAAARAAMLSLLTALLSGAAVAAEDSGAVSAVWTPKELHFVYMGFTSKFSCDGLADRMRQVLLLLGARSDLKVTPSGCTSPYGRPDPFPGVTIKMNVLTPAEAQGTTGGSTNAAPVPAHWKLIDVNAALSRDPLWQAGQCELLEQIKQSILPSFTTRNVHYQSTCVPKELTIGGTQLRAEVLVADEKAGAAPSAAPPAH